MKRLVVTFVIGHLSYAERCLPSIRSYCSKAGADFLEVKWFPEVDEEYHGNPNWSCVQHLKNFAAQDYYREILMVDSDVMFLPECPNLFDFPGDLICTTDQAWETKDGRYKDWLARNYPDSPEMDESGPYFNAGVLLFRLDAARRMDLDGPYPNDYANDQDFLNMRAGEAGLDIHWLDHRFNQRNVRGERNAVVRANHILHFVGGAKGEIHRYA